MHALSTPFVVAVFFNDGKFTNYCILIKFPVIQFFKVKILKEVRNLPQVVKNINFSVGVSLSEKQNGYYRDNMKFPRICCQGW